MLELRQNSRSPNKLGSRLLTMSLLLQDTSEGFETAFPVLVYIEFSFFFFSPPKVNYKKTVFTLPRFACFRSEALRVS